MEDIQEESETDTEVEEVEEEKRSKVPTYQATRKTSRLRRRNTNLSSSEYDFTGYPKSLRNVQTGEVASAGEVVSADLGDAVEVEVDAGDDMLQGETQQREARTGIRRSLTGTPRKSVSFSQPLEEHDPEMRDLQDRLSSLATEEDVASNEGNLSAPGTYRTDASEDEVCHRTWKFRNYEEMSRAKALRNQTDQTRRRAAAADDPLQGDAASAGIDVVSTQKAKGGGIVWMASNYEELRVWKAQRASAKQADNHADKTPVGQRTRSEEYSSRGRKLSAEDDGVVRRHSLSLSRLLKEGRRPEKRRPKKLDTSSDDDLPDPNFPGPCSVDDESARSASPMSVNSHHDLETKDSRSPEEKRTRLSSPRPSTSQSEAEAKGQVPDTQADEGLPHPLPAQDVLDRQDSFINEVLEGGDAPNVVKDQSAQDEKRDDDDYDEVSSFMDDVRRRSAAFKSAIFEDSNTDDHADVEEDLHKETAFQHAEMEDSDDGERHLEAAPPINADPLDRSERSTEESDVSPPDKYIDDPAPLQIETEDERFLMVHTQLRPAMIKWVEEHGEETMNFPMKPRNGGLYICKAHEGTTSKLICLVPEKFGAWNVSQTGVRKKYYLKESGRQIEKEQRSEAFYTYIRRTSSTTDTTTEDDVSRSSGQTKKRQKKTASFKTKLFHKVKGSRRKTYLQGLKEDDVYEVAYRDKAMKTAQGTFKRKVTRLMEPGLSHLVALEFRGNPPKEDRPHGLCRKDVNRAYLQLPVDVRQETREELTEQKTTRAKQFYGESLRRDPGRFRNVRQVQYERSKLVKEGVIDSGRRQKYASIASQLQDVTFQIYGAPTAAAFNRDFHHNIILDGNISVVLVGRKQIEWSTLQQTNPHLEQRSVLHIDATYNIAEGYLTCASIQAAPLRSHPFDSENHPIVIVACMIHTSKTTNDYLKLIDELEKHSGEAFDEAEIDSAVLLALAKPDETPDEARERLKVYGSDHEKALLAAIRKRHPNATIVLCTAHLYDNMVRMANESEVALDERNRIYSFVQSMMEQEDEDRFEEMLEEFRNCFHDPNMSKARKAFGKYMLKSIETINQHSRIPHLAHRRARAEGETYEGGDTSPSSLFPLNWTNNVAESTNSLLKRAVDHEVKSFGEVVDTVTRIMYTQMCDVEKAAYSSGNYRIDPSLHYLRVRSMEWEHMPEAARRDLVSDVFRLMGDPRQGRGRRRRSRSDIVQVSAPDEMGFRIYARAPPGVKRKPGMKGSVASNRTRPRGGSRTGSGRKRSNKDKE